MAIEKVTNAPSIPTELEDAPIEEQEQYVTGWLKERHPYYTEKQIQALLYKWRNGKGTREKATKIKGKIKEGMKFLNRSIQPENQDGWLNYKYQEGGSIDAYEDTEDVTSEDIADEDVIKFIDMLNEADNEQFEEIAKNLVTSEDAQVRDMLGKIVKLAEAGDESALACLDRIKPYAEEAVAMQRGGKFYYLWKLKCGGRMKKAKKGQRGMMLPKGSHGKAYTKESSTVASWANGGKSCGCKGTRLARIGGKIVNVDCNGRIVK